MRYLIFVFLFLLFSGCVTQPTIVVPQLPPQIGTPAHGEALVYLFRPALDKTGSRAVPFLYVNGSKVAQISASSYVAVPIATGLHTFELRPSDPFEGRWATASKFCAESGKVYFAAIWNQAQPLSSKTMPFYLSNGIFIQIPMGPLGNQGGGVVFEIVDSEFGRESLAGLSQAKFSSEAPTIIPSQAPTCGAG